MGRGGEGHRTPSVTSRDTAGYPPIMTPVPSMPSRPLRSRRSNLAVPGSSTKMIDKAKGLGADQVFLDIEDAVAPLAKPDARKNIVAALNEGGWGDTIRTVRVNDWTTQWTYSDLSLIHISEPTRQAEISYA